MNIQSAGTTDVRERLSEALLPFHFRLCSVLSLFMMSGTTPLISRFLSLHSCTQCYFWSLQSVVLFKLWHQKMFHWNNHHHQHICHGVGPLVDPFVSRIQKSLQRSAMIPSASWGIVFHYNKAPLITCPLTLRVLMSYIIYGVHILDVSRSHTTTHHSR
jgi:hypothetical protein